MNPNPICPLRRNGYRALSSIWKTWESFFQTLVKVFRLQEAEETVLVLDMYTDNEEFFLKQQGGINWVTKGLVSVFMEKTPKRCPKIKTINKTLKTQKVKLNSFTDLHNTSSKTTYSQNWKEILFLILETYRINSCKLKALFTSNHKEVDTEIVYCCSSFNKSCIVKAKDTDVT